MELQERLKDLPPSEAELLLAHAFQRETAIILNRLELYNYLRTPLPLAVSAYLNQVITRRLRGEPIQHITGVQTFLEHEYEVSPDVLIPRPETEALVTLAISQLHPAPLLGIEIGIGSGVISMELLARFPQLQMIATEVSEKAENLAMRNAQRILGRESHRLTLLRARGREEVFEPLLERRRGQADFLISNPPYLAHEFEADQEVLRYEPHEALFSLPGDPLYYFRCIAQQGRNTIQPGGAIFLEMASERASQIQDLFLEEGYHTRIEKDLAGRERILIATHG